MGRSVSTPSGAVHIVYQYLPTENLYCLHCGSFFDDYAKREVLPGEEGFDPDYDEQEDTNCCPTCGSHEDECSPVDTADDFKDRRDDYAQQLCEAFPSVSLDDDWIGREDQVVASNRYAKFGVSEYCGLVALWCVPREADYYSDPGFEGLRDRWVNSIGSKFERVVKGCFGIGLSHVGTASNGEAFFQPKDGVQKGALGLGVTSKEGWL